MRRATKAHPPAPRGLEGFFWITDLGFLLYWGATALHLIPPEYAFEGYNDPVLVAWNWSFLPLDLLVSFTGLGSLYLRARAQPIWRWLAVVSLALTLTAGLNAVSFWALRGEFAVLWWLPNLYLCLYPLWFLPRLICDAPGTVLNATAPTVGP